MTTDASVVTSAGSTSTNRRFSRSRTQMARTATRAPSRASMLAALSARSLTTPAPTLPRPRRPTPISRIRDSSYHAAASEWREEGDVELRGRAGVGRLAETRLRLAGHANGQVDPREPGQRAEVVVEVLEPVADRGVEGVSPRGQVRIARREHADVDERDAAEAARERVVADVPVEVVDEGVAVLAARAQEDAAEQRAGREAAHPGGAARREELRAALDVAERGRGAELDGQGVTRARRDGARGPGGELAGQEEVGRCAAHRVKGGVAPRDGERRGQARRVAGERLVQGELGVALERRGQAELGRPALELAPGGEEVGVQACHTQADRGVPEQAVRG